MSKKILVIMIALACASCLVQQGSAVAQTEWKKSAGKPVFDVGPAGSWDGKNVKLPSVVREGETYHMWYVGDNGTAEKIGYATSSDGRSWSGHTRPVLEKGPEGDWDSLVASAPTVLFDNGSFRMWYFGGKKNFNGVGYATSTDGITWTKYDNNPVMVTGSEVGDFDYSLVEYPCVIRAGDTYKMWYVGYDTGITGRIGYAESPDGITWTKSEENPVLDLGGPLSWDGGQLEKVSVVYDGSNYHMWYTGFRYLSKRLSYGLYMIGYAESTDGIHWVKSKANPVLRFSPRVLTSWEGRGVLGPSVISDGQQYKMWYTGVGNWGKKYHKRIGYAESAMVNGDK